MNNIPGEFFVVDPRNHMPVVGDYVLLASTNEKGVVTNVFEPVYDASWTTPLRCNVSFLDGTTVTRPCTAVLVVPCCHCGYGRSAHTFDGKCIYGPGNWEEP